MAFEIKCSATTKERFERLLARLGREHKGRPRHDQAMHHLARYGHAHQDRIVDEFRTVGSDRGDGAVIQIDATTRKRILMIQAHVAAQKAQELTQPETLARIMRLCEKDIDKVAATYLDEELKGDPLGTMPRDLKGKVKRIFDEFRFSMSTNAALAVMLVIMILASGATALALFGDIETVQAATDPFGAAAADRSLSFESGVRDRPWSGASGHAFHNMKTTIMQGNELILLTDASTSVLDGLHDAVNATEEPAFGGGKLAHDLVVAGDLDGDPRDELLLIDTTGKAKARITDGHAADAATLLTFTETVLYGAIGDLDGDSIGEIALVGPAVNGITVWILDDATTGFALLHTFAPTIFDDIVVTGFEAGDLDDDGEAELVLAGRPRAPDATCGTPCALGGFGLPRAYALDSKTQGFGVMNKWLPQHFEPRAGKHVPGNPEVALANLDQDASLETVFALENGADAEGRVFVFDDPGTVGTARGSAFALLRSWPCGGAYGRFDGTGTMEARTRIALRVGDVDADGLAEIVCGTTNMRGLHDSVIVNIYDDRESGFASIKFWDLPEILDGTFTDATFLDLAVLDTDHDLHDEIVILYREWKSAYLEGVKEPYGDSRYRMAAYVNDLESWSRTVERTPSGDPTQARLSAFTADVDGDKTRLQHTGERWRTASEPVRLMAIAAPPMAGGADQVRPGVGTWFGAFGGERASENMVNFTTATTLSYMDEATRGFVTRPLEFALAYALVWSGTPLEVYVNRTQTATDHVDDVVLYAEPEHRIFEYRIESHPDAAAVDQVFTVDVPEKVPVKAARAVDFDAAVARRLALGNATWRHVAGDPGSYPDKEEMLAAQAGSGAWRSSLAFVRNGDGLEAAFISMRSADAAFKDLRVFTSGPSGNATAARTYTVTDTPWHIDRYTVRLGLNAQATGVVGQIPDADTAASESYFYGMFMGPFDVDGDNITDLFRIHYWVEEYRGEGGAFDTPLETGIRVTVIGIASLVNATAAFGIGHGVWLRRRFL